MGVILNLLLWPAGAVAIYLLQPLLFPGEPPPPLWLLALVAGVGMASCIWNFVIRQILGERERRKPPLSEPDE